MSPSILKTEWLTLYSENWQKGCETWRKSFRVKGLSQLLRKLWLKPSINWNQENISPLPEVFPKTLFSLTVSSPYLSSDVLWIEFPTDKGRTKASRRLNTVRNQQPKNCSPVRTDSNPYLPIQALTSPTCALLLWTQQLHESLLYLVSWPHTQNWHYTATTSDFNTNCSEEKGRQFSICKRDLL